jgi:hypothetical protein
MPDPIGPRSLLSENVEIPVIGADLIKDTVRLIPLVEHVLHGILLSFEPESNRAFVRLSAGIALYVHLHPFIVDQ